MVKGARREKCGSKHEEQEHEEDRESFHGGRRVGRQWVRNLQGAGARVCVEYVNKISSRKEIIYHP